LDHIVRDSAGNLWRGAAAHGLVGERAWFRNTWSWFTAPARPSLARALDEGGERAHLFQADPNWHDARPTQQHSRDAAQTLAV
jgi:hypothetical protein